MITAIIFAGGTGQRMNTRTVPKQFLELHGKPIIVYTLEQFQKHELVDKIIIVMLENYIDYCSELIKRYCLDKVCAVIPGGNNGQASIYNGIKKATELFPEDSVVMIHDGVRPLINGDTITSAIECTKKYGSAITVSQAVETITVSDEGENIGQIIDRSKCKFAKAPQCFILKDISAAHEQALKDGKNDFIDSASLMKFYGYKLHTIEGSPENIKITTPTDFYIFRALIDAKENSQIFGI